MIQNQIIQLQKGCHLIILKNSLNNDEIKQKILENIFHQQIKIICNLDDLKASFMGQLLKQLNGLTFLDIQYNPSQRVTLQPLADLGESLTALKQLNYLIININQKELHEDNEIFTIKFGLGLSELQNLQFFKLDTENIELLGIEGANAISKSLNELNQLTTISYKIGLCKNKDETYYVQLIKYLCNGQNLKNCIKEFNLQFKDQSIMSDEGLQEISNIFNQLSNLQRIYLKFNKEATITNQGILYLKKSIQDLKHLKQITIQSRIIVSSVFEFVEIENLENLILFLQIDQESIEQFSYGNNIKKNNKLKQLSLYLVNSQIDSFYSYLTLDKNILYLTQLIELNLILNCFNVDQLSFQVLLTLLNTNQNLRTLSIDFDFEFSSSHLDYLSKSISSLKFLNKLSFTLFIDDNLKSNFFNKFKRKNIRLTYMVPSQ